MLKGIVASFIGTFLALAAIGAVAYVLVDRGAERAAAELTVRLEGRIQTLGEQLSSVAASLRERPAAQALAAAQERKAALAAFAECVREHEAGQPAAAVDICLEAVAP
jgi:hypothetical protein